nr:TRAP transporter substrate-binding protein [uncultured Oscillibacter sp.]
MKKRMALFLSVVMAIALLTGCSGNGGNRADTPSDSSNSSGETVKIQLAHSDTENEDGIHQKMSMLFANYVKELSNGAMEIEIVGNGQLGGERDLVEGMQLGTIEMASTANMVLSNFDPRFSVLDLPYLITDYETAYKILDSDVMRELTDNFAEQSGIRVLTYGQGGFRQVIGNIAVNALSDLKGMKIRVPESDIYIDTFNALGANPTPLAYTETFTALQQGTVDAFEITPAVVLSAGFFEVCSDISMINHLYSPNPFMISESLFQSLSEEQQGILTEAAQKAAADQRKWLEDGETETLASLEEKGMTVNYPDLPELQNAVEASGLYDKYKSTIGEELFQNIQALCR